MRTSLFAALGALGGCTPAGVDPSSTAAVVGDWATVNALFDRECLACHGAGTTTGVLLPADVELDLLREDGVYVVPFDPDASLLWRVLWGDGATMPYGTGPLPDDEIAPVRAFIEDGARIDWQRVDLDGDGSMADVDCDETDPDVTDGFTWYFDADGDGYGDAARSTESCEAPDGYVAGADDCDDTDAAYNPGAVEDDCADPNDYNCDGSAGRVDADADGFAACEECDDARAASFPGATETCDGLDDDCDGAVDEDAADALTWYADADGDGYGDPDRTTLGCDAPAGYVGDASDCDDSDPAVSPGAALDPLDGRDNDCDRAVDEDARPYSHAADVQPIWDAECVSCHGGRVPSAGLDLSSDGYADLVGIPSTQAPSMDLVSPGSPDASYLWHKLNGTEGTVGGSGSAMPKGGSPTAADLATVEAWILDGAAP